MINLHRIIGLAIASFFVASASPATIYNLSAQWSNSSNPNGVWSYREGNNGLQNILNYDFAGTVSGFTPQTAWAPSNTAGTFLPVWLQSSQTGTPNGFTPGSVLPGDVIVHSQDNGNGAGKGPANVAWTAPTSGTIDISGDMWWVRQLGRVNDYSVFLNGALIAQGSVTDGSVYTRSSPLAFSALPGASLSNIPVTQ